MSEDRALEGDAEGIVVGTEVLGDVGQAAAPRARRWQLADVSLALVKYRKTTRRLLHKLLSTLLHALMFRGPMLSILQACYALLPPLE